METIRAFNFGMDVPFEPAIHIFDGSLLVGAFALTLPIRLARHAKHLRPPLRKPRVALGRWGLLGRLIGCGGGHVSGVSFWGCIGCCRAACGGSDASRLSCPDVGMTVARKGDTRLRYPNPCITRPSLLAGQASACIRRPGVRVGRRPIWVKRIVPDMSGMTGSAGRAHDDR
jgi:hypothetical protein